MLLPIQTDHPEPRKIKRAVDALEAGEVIGYPTDTVYGLGCDLFNKKAIDRLYQIKEMDRSQQLAFICPDLGDIARYAIVENAQYRILRRLLPGPYCFILEATREVPAHRAEQAQDGGHSHPPARGDLGGRAAARAAGDEHHRQRTGR